MTVAQVHVSSRRLRTPRAAALAGIIFAVLQITSFILLNVFTPAIPRDSTDWFEQGAGYVSLALTLVPFAAIAFLWFMGVVRDRLGYLEDQFFSTLFFGSGLLYLSMTLAAAAIAGGIISVYSVNPELLQDVGVYRLSRSVIYNFNNVYAIRMAGMHMLVLGTIWFRTMVMPRWIVLITYLLAALLMFTINLFPWITLAFPGWVLVISFYVLILNFRYGKEEASSDGLTIDA
jgi:hypothetical protein